MALSLLWGGGARDNDNSDRFEQVEDDAFFSSPSKFVNTPKKDVVVSWEEAHRAACLARGSLVASPKDVLEDQKTVRTVTDHPLRSQVIMWTNEEEKAHAAELVAQRLNDEDKQLQEEKEATTTKVSSSTLWKVSKSVLGTASTVYNMVAGYQEDDQDVDVDLEQEVLDDQANEEAQQEPADWNDPVLSVDLAVSCCQAVLKRINFVRVFDRGEPLYKWLREADNQNEQESLSIEQLGDQELDFLTQSLAVAKRAKFPEDDASLAVIFPTTQVPESQVDVAVAVHKIRRAQSQTEANLERWNAQSEASRKRALMLSKQPGRKQQALTELRKKALLEKHIDTAHTTLLNLQQAESALELAENQRQTTALLIETSKTLRDTIISPVEKVDDVALDLQEELEQLTETVESQKTMLPSLETTDEEELLNELAQLTATQSQDDESTKETKLDVQADKSPSTPANVEKTSKKHPVAEVAVP